MVGRQSGPKLWVVKFIFAMRKTRILITVLWTVALSVANAQFLDLGGSLTTTAPGADFATFAQLFGKNAAFTARSEVRVHDQNQRETMSTTMEFAMLENKLRLEIDTAATKNKDLPADAAASLKPLGLDQVHVIMRPDRQVVYFSFPKAGMFINLPMDKAELAAAEKSRITIEKLSEETLDGQRCLKNQVTITAASGDQQQLTVWNAINLKNLPIKTVQKQGEETITTRYSNIQFIKPDAKKFEPPAGAEEFKGMAAFVQGMMKKALNGDLPAGQ